MTAPGLAEPEPQFSIRLVNVTKRYERRSGPVTVLDGANLEGVLPR